MLREIAEMDFQNKQIKFTKIPQKYMNEINVSKNSLLDKRNNQTNRHSQMDRRKNTKITLEIYNRFKTNIKEENHLHDKSEDSIILFRVRTNTLLLNWRNIHKPNSVENDQMCPVCRNKRQKPQSQTIRQTHQLWEQDNQNEILENIICFGKRIDVKKLQK